MKEKKYKHITIKSGLKNKLDETIVKIGKKMSYSDVIIFLINDYEKNEKMKK